MDLVATRSRRIEKDGRLDAVMVESMYQTKGMHGQQFVYEVGVLDSTKRPVMAKRSSFRNSRGEVAGSRTVRSEEVTGTPSHVTVNIPANMIAMGERQLPAFARVRLTSVEGELAAETIVQLPLSPPDVLAMGGEPAYLPDAGADSDPYSRDERVAVASDSDESRGWEDESEPRYATRETPSRRGDNLRRSTRDRRSPGRDDADSSRESTNTSERSDRSADSRESASDDLTYWTPDREPVPKREPRSPARRPDSTTHDDRLNPPVASRDESDMDRRSRSKSDARAEEISRLESVVRRSPNDIESQMRLRMLYLAENREADALAPTASADAATSARIEEYLAAVLTPIRNGEVDPATLTLGRLDEWVERSRSSKRLTIPVAAFCRSIDGFGKFRGFDRAEFRVGRIPKLTVYLEVDNFVSTRSPQGVYRTLLSVEQKLLNSAGEQIWFTLDREIPDLSNERRSEFFIGIGPIDFEQDLPADDYTLVISLRDVLGQASCEKRLKFKITN